MVNISKLVIATVGFVITSFVIKNFVLKQEFDVVSSIFDMIIVVASLWLGGMLVSKVTKKDAKIVNL